MLLQKISGSQDIHTLETLLKNEHLFEALVASSTDGITVLDDVGNILFRNRSAELITGYRTEDLVGLRSFELMHPDDREAEFTAYQKFAKKPGKILKRRYRIKHKNGNYIWMDLTLRNWLDKTGIHGIVTTYRDVTKEVEYAKYLNDLEQQLTISNHIYELVSATENMYDFVSGVYSSLKQYNSVAFCALLDIRNNCLKVLESTDVARCGLDTSRILAQQGPYTTKYQILDEGDCQRLVLLTEGQDINYIIVAEFSVSKSELNLSLIRQIGITFSMGLSHLETREQFKKATQMLLNRAKG